MARGPIDEQIRLAMTVPVPVEHRSLARHGEGGGACRQGLAAAEGWPYILDRYARYAATLR